MFSIYGMSGPLFRGTLEQLAQVREAARLRQAPALAGREDELGPELPASTPGRAALEAYRRVLHQDLERGPLYHAHQLMQRRLLCVQAADPVERAWRSLVQGAVHQAPVLEQGHLVGVVGERNLLTALNVDQGSVRDVLERRVADVMSSPVVTADPVTDIRRVAQVMLEFDVDGVPVVDAQGLLVGFISRVDILRAVLMDPPLNLWR